MKEGGWEDPPETRGLGQDQGRELPGAAAGRGPGVLPPWERRQQDRGPGCGQGWDRDCAVGGCGVNRAADPGAEAASAAAVTMTTGKMTTTRTLGTMAKTETMEEEGGGEAATATVTSEMWNRR